MGNRETGAVSFKSGDSRLVLKYSTNALCELEDSFGKSAIEVANELNSETGIKVRALRMVFWCGLIDHQPGLSEKEAGALIDELGLEKAGQLIGEAFMTAFPSPEETDASGKSKRQVKRSR